MGQEEISILLRKTYPEYISYKEIMIELGAPKRIVYSNLSRMIKRQEIEYIMVLNDKGVWIKRYREKR